MDDKKKIAELEGQLALRELYTADLASKIKNLEALVADLDGRNPNPEFRALREELEANREASRETEAAFLAEKSRLHEAIEVLRFDLDAKEAELEATREALNSNLARPVEPLEIRSNGHTEVHLTYEAQEATVLPS